MKKIFGIFASILLVLLCVSLTACGNKAEEGTVTRVEMSVNPDIEFMIDSNNKVIAVTALNDDGSVLISGEQFVGLDYEEAINNAMALAKSMGYLMKANTDNYVNEIKLSVSGATRYAKGVKENITSNIQTFLADNDISGTVKSLNAMTVEELRAEAVNTAMVTEDEAKEMDEKQLLKVISASRIETAELLTKEMREAYYRAKEHKISFVEREETLQAMEGLTGLYSTAYSLYSVALGIYSSALDALDEARYNYFVSPESDYQKALAELREKKAEILEDRNYLLTLNVNGEEYASVSLEITASEEEYDQMVDNLEQLGSNLNASLDQLVAKLRDAETALYETYNKLPLPSDFNQTLKDKASELETKLNETKDKFFEEYEKDHKDDLDILIAQLAAEKQKILDSAKTNSNGLA
ncbi:hypothetical protein IKQ02_01895 [bacterium]|nr:hypothetical protein [bacterium]